MLNRSESSPRFRTYGAAPFNVVLVHGGPGAAGEMASLAAELAADRGVLEPLQTASSVAGQIAELINVIENQGTSPVVLVGFSWGAWLSLMSQYFPAHLAPDRPPCDRRLLHEEWRRVRDEALRLGLDEGWFQEMD